MVALDHGGFAQAALNHIRINGSLHQEIHSADFLRLFFKHADEFLADYLSFIFRLHCAGKLFIKTLLRVHTDKIQIIGTIGSEYLFHLVPFVFAKQAVIHKNTGKLFPHSF